MPPAERALALERPVARGAHGAAACGHRLAATAAVEIFRCGGNALDAAIAAAASLCVLLPESCGLGGDALFMVRDAFGHVEAYNGTGLSPAHFDGIVPSDGAGTATVPGLVAALEDAHARYGSLPFGDLMAPAVRLALDGFPASESLTQALERQSARLDRGASDWDVARASVAPGVVVRQPSLGRMLERIGVEGSAAFYTGATAEAIERAVSGEHGALSAQDLLEHRTVQRAPLSQSFRGAIVHAQPPSSQAILALMALGELDQLESDRRAQRVHVAVEALEGAFAHRHEITAPGAEERLLRVRLGVDLERAQRRGGPTVATHTTAVATADVNGTVISMVISVFDEFGCATLVPEGGFFLNNRMDGFARDGEVTNRAAPSTRPVHTLSPLLVENQERSFAIATPGADGQVQTLTQLLDAVLVERLTFQAALDRRRWRTSRGTLFVEEGCEHELIGALLDLGHDVALKPRGDRSFGAAVIAGLEHEHGSALAVADLRRDAWAAAY